MSTARAIDPNDIAPDLEQRHRDAMLDLVLAWGSLDGALGVLLSDVLGVPLDQGAELIGGRPSSGKLAEVVKFLRNAPGGAEPARIMKKYKKQYERHAGTRNFIAHSDCKGVWTLDRNYIVFMKFEKVETNELAIYAISIEEMQRATRWGRRMKATAMKLAAAFSTAA